MFKIPLICAIVLGIASTGCQSRSTGESQTTTPANETALSVADIGQVYCSGKFNDRALFSQTVSWSTKAPQDLDAYPTPDSYQSESEGLRIHIHVPQADHKMSVEVHFQKILLTGQVNTDSPLSIFYSQGEKDAISVTCLPKEKARNHFAVSDFVGILNFFNQDKSVEPFFIARQWKGDAVEELAFSDSHPSQADRLRGFGATLFPGTAKKPAMVRFEATDVEGGMKLHALGNLDGGMQINYQGEKSFWLEVPQPKNK